MSRTLHYAYTHTSTEATTGYFSCEPVEALTLEEALVRLEAAPLDEFLHRHLLRHLVEKHTQVLQDWLAQTLTAQGHYRRPVLAALLLECALLHAQHAPLQRAFPADAAAVLADYTPLPYLGWSRLPDRELHQAWSELFSANIHGHHAMPRPDDDDLPLLPFPEEPVQAEGPGIAELHARMAATPGLAYQRPPAQETAARALERLLENAIPGGPEMRHEASLSPIALLRAWKLHLAVHNGALDYTLQGDATVYGRGLSLGIARASYAMEMVERASSYLSVQGLDLPDLQQPRRLLKARYSALQDQGIAALHPDQLPLEVPYADQELHWIEAREAGTDAPVRVPVQFVSLFCNLDEVALQMSPGSTGLASGNTLAEAKQAALTEIFERDAEATTPYHRSSCFTLRSRDPRLQALLDDYEARGIQIRFQDITGEFGIPCYKCFVLNRKGQVARGTGAGLDGARALLAALTETPYPYPHGGISGPGLRGIPERWLEDLPTYTLESPERNVALMEAVLLAHGRRPLYVELTRKDLGFPVVRALVPQMELTADWDHFSRIRPRLFRNYLKLFQEQA